MKSLISIIIPTYNRAHLILETLASIKSQTYQEWECIVVDDGSTDHTEEVVTAFAKGDKRFSYHKRPQNRPKGANACRNYGFELSEGEFIQWFDSDDLMLPEKLQQTMKAAQDKGAQLVISKTKNFDHPYRVSVYRNDGNNYRFGQFCLCQYHFVNQELTWLTPDALIHRELVKGIRWNEYLTRGQEYNFFSKLLGVPVKAAFVDRYLTLRRRHDGSIKSSFNPAQTRDQAIDLRILTLREIYSTATKQTKRFLIYKILKGMARNPGFRGAGNEFFVLRKSIALTNFEILSRFVFARILKVFTGRNERFIKNLCE